jgi:hypothetical protein
MKWTLDRMPQRPAPMCTCSGLLTPFLSLRSFWIEQQRRPQSLLLYGHRCQDRRIQSVLFQTGSKGSFFQYQVLVEQLFVSLTSQLRRGARWWKIWKPLRVLSKGTYATMIRLLWHVVSSYRSCSSPHGASEHDPTPKGDYHGSPESELGPTA